MKIIFLIPALFLAVLSQGQKLAEWTKQKKTQIKYLLEQIAANQVYLEYVEKGYGIAKKALNTIQSIKKGDFYLHSDYIASLSHVNPRVKSYARVADIITCQVRIVKNINAAIRQLKESNQFVPDELAYSKSVFEGILEESLKDLDELLSIITSDEFRMKDDERIKRIDQLYLAMQDKLSFCQWFSEECSILAMQRLNETIEIRMSKKINGLE